MIYLYFRSLFSAIARGFSRGWNYDLPISLSMLNHAQKRFSQYVSSWGFLKLRCYLAFSSIFPRSTRETSSLLDWAFSMVSREIEAPGLVYV